MTNTAKKGRNYELEVIKIFEERGYHLIMRATRFRFGIVEFGCFDIVLGTTNPYGNHRLLIQVKTDCLRTEVLREIQEWMRCFGIKDEIARIAVRKKFKGKVFYDLFDLEGNLVERIEKKTNLYKIARSFTYSSSNF